MTRILSTNITSPLGFSSIENYLAVKRGKTALKEESDWSVVPGRICVSKFSGQQRAQLALPAFTWFETLAVRSVAEALLYADIDLASDRVVFILSTTKANVDELSVSEDKDGDYLDPGETAGKIASYLGFSSKPIVICNACISGVTAQVVADRLISCGLYDYAVICGVDTLSAFTVAGFTSFKALSSSECLPFDIERTGLNLGEAAATMVLGRSDCMERTQGGWYISAGCLTNDAYHVSAPSPDGDGMFRAMKKVLDSYPDVNLATVSAHGTATMFNDQMESKAIQNASLGAVPVTAYKSIFGHTLGASGLLESILSMCSVDDGILLPVRGFKELGVSGRIKINQALEKTDKKAFLKIISGFGGCNGAVLYSKERLPEKPLVAPVDYSLVRRVSVSYDSFSMDGKQIAVNSCGESLLTELMKTYAGDYPKFYKMDLFSRLAFVSVCVLLHGNEHLVNTDRISMVFFNKTSSILSDRQHLCTVLPPAEFYPSPSTFLYTLPNVVMGEIAVKFKIKGETTFVILAEKDDKMIDGIVKATVEDTTPSAMIYGWVDCASKETFSSELKLTIKQ